MTDEPKLMSTLEAARYFAISESMFAHNWRDWKVPYVPVGKRGVRFRREDLDYWLEKKARVSP